MADSFFIVNDDSSVKSKIHNTGRRQNQTMVVPNNKVDNAPSMLLSTTPRNRGRAKSVIDPGLVTGLNLTAAYQQQLQQSKLLDRDQIQI